MATTSNPIRQEVSDNRRAIRAQTDEFLGSVQFNTSDYAQLNYIFGSNILEEAGAINTSLLQAPDPALTGALTATLPMYIALGDKNNKKLQFMMLVNPANMTHGKTSTVQAAYTRKGFVTQMWGPNQDLLTSTGKTAAFMVEGSGLTNLARRRSFAYANFLAFVLAYRNNGYGMLDPTRLGTALTRVINVVHGVEIVYDNQIFTGHFNNFTIDEAAEKPFLFDYNFEFVCTSLDDDFSEIRGHYTPIDINTGEADARLIEQINEENEALVERFNPQTGVIEDGIDPGTGELSPGLSFLDPTKSLIPEG